MLVIQARSKMYNKMFLCVLFQVSVTQTTEGFLEPQEIKTLGVGDYFGEKALIRFGEGIILKCF